MCVENSELSVRPWSFTQKAFSNLAFFFEKATLEIDHWKIRIVGLEEGYLQTRTLKTYLKIDHC